MNQSPNLNRSWEESQQIIKSLEKELSAKQAEILQLKAEREAQSCRCHIIDPAKMRILLWINRHKNGKPDTCVLKIAEQRLLGLPRSDRRGETYWRFDELLEKKENEVSQKETTPQTSFKCDECKAEVVVISSDYKEAIKQRAKLKQELAAMEPVAEVQKETQAEPQVKLPEAQNEPKTKRQILKEQIAQAIKENQQAEKLKEKQAQEQNQLKENASQ